MWHGHCNHWGIMTWFHMWIPISCKYFYGSASRVSHPSLLGSLLECRPVCVGPTGAKNAYKGSRIAVDRHETLSSESVAWS